MSLLDLMFSFTCDFLYIPIMETVQHIHALLQPKYCALKPAEGEPNLLARLQSLLRL